MLFEQSTEEFSNERFRNPAACYRGTPFWSWNTLMTKEMIERQILCFKQMGMGGFHVHVRVGLKNQYMSDEFLELVHFCREKAKENGMLCWLYDEDRYSSGIAGGEVTKRIYYRARWLKLTVQKQQGMLDSFEEFLEKQSRNEKVKGCFLRAYDVVLRSGHLESVRIIDKDDAPKGVKWYLYIELAEESAWCNGQTYVDTMKKEAIGSFIHLTHDRYSRKLQEEFGRSIPAIFTDEPHINGLRLPEKAEGPQAVRLPFTEILPDLFGTVDGKDFYEAIPYIVWNRKDETASPFRYRYYRTISELFAESYCGQVGDWCEKHHLLSTGHLLGEDSIRSQAASVGDAMRCYREFQLPGIDNLCDNRDFLAAKQAASVTHQCQKEGVLSELYGVTQWDFDFEGYKLAGDWQAALGVTVRVPHLAWASMNGEAKRDYPAAIGWQSPWYKDYNCIEDHFARVNYCLTRGKPVIRVGVLHIIESFWLLQGPADQSEDKKKQYEDEFLKLTELLLMNGIDFDYIGESSLENENSRAEDCLFHCGAMGYSVVLVPVCINLRSTTMRKLAIFADNGGTVIFIGEAPEYVDCRKNEELKRLVDRCETFKSSGQELLNRLAEWREVDIREHSGKRTFQLLHQLREEKDGRWLFIAQAYRGMRGRQDEVWSRRALHAPLVLDITIKGCWNVERYDTLTGEVSRLDSQCKNGATVVPYELYGDDSLMLRLRPRNSVSTLEKNIRTEKKDPIANRQKIYDRQMLSEPIEYRMSEPNVLLLDKFEYALDNEEYQDSCEMLKLDNRLREKLHLPLRCESLVQPYIRIKEDVRDHKLRLRTYFDSSAELSDCCLALEEAAHCVCVLNGQPVDMRPQGYYVDPAISVVKLPVIEAGKNVLCIEMEYGDCTDLEWMYILGDFGVELRGAHASLYKKPERLFWGDYTRQGFPFYTGNMTYVVRLPEMSCDKSCEDGLIQIPYYSGAAVKISSSAGKERLTAFLPYTCKLKDLELQDDILLITCLGNRYNGFGQLHLIGDDDYWLGQNSWRTEGTSWTDTYRVKEMGVLTAPMIIS